MLHGMSHHELAKGNRTLTAVRSQRVQLILVGVQLTSKRRANAPCDMHPMHPMHEASSAAASSITALTNATFRSLRSQVFLVFMVANGIISRGYRFARLVCSTRDHAETALLGPHNSASTARTVASVNSCTSRSRPTLMQLGIEWHLLDVDGSSGGKYLPLLRRNRGQTCDVRDALRARACVCLRICAGASCLTAALNRTKRSSSSRSAAPTGKSAQ